MVIVLGVATCDSDACVAATTIVVIDSNIPVFSILKCSIVLFCQLLVVLSGIEKIRARLVRIIKVIMSQGKASCAKILLLRIVAVTFGSAIISLMLLLRVIHYLIMKLVNSVFLILWRQLLIEFIKFALFFMVFEHRTT